MQEALFSWYVSFYFVNKFVLMVGFEYIFKYYANVGTIFELQRKKDQKKRLFWEKSLSVIYRER